MVTAVDVGAVEKGECVVLQILVEAVVVVDDPGLVLRSGEEVFAKSQIGALCADEVKQGGHDVDLLCGCVVGAYR